MTSSYYLPAYPLSSTTVRLANLMKVLTSDAVQDPTRVEARVRREVAMRRHTHEKMNAERKLTAEERRERVETKKVDQDYFWLFGCVLNFFFFFFFFFFFSLFLFIKILLFFF